MAQLSNDKLKAMGLEDLRLKVEELRKELFELRLKSGVSHVKTYPSDQKKLKRSIARALTHLNQREMNKKSLSKG